MDTTSTIADSLMQIHSSPSALSQWIPVIIGFGGVLLGFILATIKELLSRKNQEKQELIGVLTAVLAQFERNSERLQEFIENIEGNPSLIPTPRLIVVFVENNANTLVLRLKKHELLKRIIHTYEEHTHINRRWDFLARPGFAHNTDNELEASSKVLDLTLETITQLEEYIKVLETN